MDSGQFVAAIDNTRPELHARETADDVWSQLKKMKDLSTEFGKAHQRARIQRERPLIGSTREQYVQALMQEREYILQKRNLLPSLVSGNATNRLYAVNREIERVGTLEEKRAVYVPELQQDFTSIDRHLRNIMDTSFSPEQHLQTLREADRARSYLLSSVKLVRELGLEDQFQGELSKYERLKELVPPGSMIT